MCAARGEPGFAAEKEGRKEGKKEREKERKSAGLNRVGYAREFNCGKGNKKREIALGGLRE